MTILQYLDNRNKRKYLKYLLEKEEKELNVLRQLAELIDINSETKVRLWNEGFNKTKNNIDDLKLRLSSL